MIVGILSDTHGLLRPEAVGALQGAARIIHAGDVGKPEVLRALERIAPTVVVRGNVDRDESAQAWPERLTLRWEGIGIHVLHDLTALLPADLDADCCLVISGHSHLAKLEERGGVTYLNPGSAGPRRFRLPVTMAKLHLPGDGTFSVEPLVLLP